MSAPTSSRAPLPLARLVERRHRLAALPAPPLRTLVLPLAALAAPSRAFAAAMLGLWPITAVTAIGIALAAAAGS